jgi:hypothetical protein
MVELRLGMRDRIVATETRSEGQDCGNCDKDEGTVPWKLRQGVRDRMVAAETREVQDPQWPLC